MLARQATTGDPLRPAGWGVTDKYGNVTYSTAGSARDQALALYHEKRVHQVLSPRLSLLREVRADFGAKVYQKSQLCRYLEEMLAEAHAQLRVNGVRGLPDAIRFPIANGYVTLDKVIREGAVATVGLGGTVYAVYLTASELSEDSSP